MRFWAKSNAIMKADWEATLAGFITRDAKAIRPTVNDLDPRI